MAVTRLEVGKYYRFVGPDTAYIDFWSIEMNKFRDGLPKLCERILKEYQTIYTDSLSAAYSRVSALRVGTIYPLICLCSKRSPQRVYR